MAEWFSQHLGWMYWTVPTATFFSGLLMTLIAMTLIDRRTPSIPRKGFLPIATTRGDRLFIVIITGIGLHLLWLAVFGDAWLYVATALAALCAGIIARWG